jgi:PAS domain S-box-containing protein
MTLVGPLIGRLKDALRSRSHRGLMGDLRASEVRADAAQARESFLRQAQEVARLGTWVSGPADEDRLEWSDQSYRIFGLTRGNFDGRVETFFNLVHPDDRARVREASRAALLEGRPYDIDHRVLWPDGTVRWVHERADIVRDAEGRPLRMIGIVQDITESKRVEHELRESRELLTLAQQAAKIGSAAWDIRTGKIVWTAESEELFGLEPGASIGDLQSWKKRLHPEDLPRVEAALTDALKSGRYETEYRVVWPDGTVRWIAIRGRVLYEDGRPARAFGMHMDVTDAKNAERAMAESKRFAESLLETANVLIVQTDQAGRIDTFNQMAEIVTGRAKADMQGRTWAELVSDPAQKVPPRIFETRLPTRHGERWISWVSNDVRKDGAVVGRISFGIDVTQRRQAEEQLRASLHEKEVLLREIHHRVKNNLQVISSLLSLQAGQLGDARAREVLKESQDRVKSMALVHERLYQSPHLSRVDAADYVRDLMAHLTRSYKIGSSVSCRVEADSVTLGVDTAIACGLILNELVSNAFKHAFGARPPGAPPPEVVVSLSCDGARCRLLVRDNGPGLPDDFDVRGARSLGMRLVHSLTAQLGGELDVRRDGGAVFRLTFENRAAAASGRSPGEEAKA